MSVRVEQATYVVVLTEGARYSDGRCEELILERSGEEEGEMEDHAVPQRKEVVVRRARR